MIRLNLNKEEYDIDTLFQITSFIGTGNTRQANILTNEKKLNIIKQKCIITVISNNQCQISFIENKDKIKFIYNDIYDK